MPLAIRAIEKHGRSGAFLHVHVQAHLTPPAFQLR